MNSYLYSTCIYIYIKGSKTLPPTNKASRFSFTRYVLARMPRLLFWQLVIHWFENIIINLPLPDWRSPYHTTEMSGTYSNGPPDRTCRCSLFTRIVCHEDLPQDARGNHMSVTNGRNSTALLRSVIFLLITARWWWIACCKFRYGVLKSTRPSRCQSRAETGLEERTIYRPSTLHSTERYGSVRCSGIFGWKEGRTHAGAVRRLQTRRPEYLLLQPFCKRENGAQLRR